MFQHIMDELNIRSFISCNGSYVVYEGEVVYRKPVDASDLHQLNEAALSHGHGMVLSDINAKGMWATVKHHPYIEKALGHLKVPYPPYHQHRIEDVCYALLFCNEEEEARYRNKYANIDFIRWHELAVDVINKGGSKAKGIEALLTHLNIDKAHAVAFGDGVNDIEMLGFVGTGVAMGNASPIVKEAADVVTKDVTDSGIRHGLEQVGLL